MAEFTMPSLGADMDAGTLVEWLVHEGDTVHRGDPMAVVDTDKSAIEVESFDDGVVQRFLVEPGTRVAVGTPLAALGPVVGEPPAHRRPHAPRAVPPPLRHHAAELGVDLTTLTGTGADGTVTREDVDRAAAPRRPRVSPHARLLARDLEVDLADVAPGPDGAVHAEQVRAAAARKAPARAAAPPPVTAPRAAVPAQRPAPAPPPASASVPTPVAAPAPRTAAASRGTIAALMSRAKREIPHYYVATTVDLTVLTRWLQRTNRERPVSERLVPAAALIKATALTARDHPELNGFWVEDAFEPGVDVHLGVAVHVRGGALVAPAIHHTADLTLGEVMSALRDLVTRARAGRLRRAEMVDPTLTVTDLGDQGVEEVIGVIYPPQVALLGVGRVAERPWAVDGMVGARPTVRLTLSGDHRATDGATGATFLNDLEEHLQHPEEL